MSVQITPTSSPTGTVNYHTHSPTRQAYRLDPDGDDGRLDSPEHVVTEIALFDVRDPTNSTSFADDGIAFLNAPTETCIEGSDWESPYEAELKALLVRELGAEEVIVFDHTIRVDDPNALRRPARNVHTDYSPGGARARLDALLGEEEAALWAAGRYAFVNVWRPVSEVVLSAPLGFVRPRTVAADDWVTLDLIYPDRVGEIMGLVASPAHQWLYRSAMTSDEVVIFNIHDNGGRPPVAHSAIDLPQPQTLGRVRKSLESRTLVRYPSPTSDQD